MSGDALQLEGNRRSDVADISGSPPTGSRHGSGRCGAWLTLSYLATMSPDELS